MNQDVENDIPHGLRDFPANVGGKIMRRLMREMVTTHSVTGDVTTLEDMAVVNRLAAQHDDET